jgi:hypothetical protein
VIAGALMFISQAMEYPCELRVLVKLIIMGLPGINMLAFQLITYNRVTNWDCGARVREIRSVHSRCRKRAVSTIAIARMWTVWQQGDDPEDLLPQRRWDKSADASFENFRSGAVSPYRPVSDSRPR